MERNVGDFFEDGHLHSQHASWIRQNVVHLLHVIRPNAVALVDACDFETFVSGAPWDNGMGKCIRPITEAAEKDPL
jgi:acyl-CoA oxidase